MNHPNPHVALLILHFFLAVAFAAEPAAEAPAAESKPDAKLLIRADNSGVLTIGEDEHVIPADELKSRFDELLVGRSHLEFRMEDWKNFERVAGDLMIGAYDLGIRKVSWAVEKDGKTQRQTAALEPPTLAEQLKDPKRQAEAIATATKWINSDVPREVTRAMAAIKQAHKLKIEFDKTPFLGPVRAAIAADPPDGNLQYALQAIGIVGGDESDIPNVLKHFENNKWPIRALMGSVLVSLDKKGEHPDVGPALLKLLDVPKLRTGTIKSFWGHALAAEVEERLIELSYYSPEPPLDLEGRQRYQLASTTIYYALSTRPMVRLPIANRLAEISTDDSPNSSRAVWGLSHHQVKADARSVAMDTFLRVLESSTDQQTRRNAVYGLGEHGLPADENAKLRLKDLMENEAEPDMIRIEASKSLKRINNQPKPPPA